MFRHWIGLGLASGLTLTATLAASEEVTLRTADNSLILTGDLEEFDGTFYFLRTKVGLLRIAAQSILCEGGGCPVIEVPRDIAISGAGDLSRGLIPQLLSAYGDSSSVSVSGSGAEFSMSVPGESDPVAITIAPSNSTLGIADLAAGRAMVSLSTRAANDDEMALLQAAGAGQLQEHIIAIEGLVIVTAPGNSLPSISMRDAAQMFSGSYTNWSQLGGPDAPINLYARSGDTAVGEVFNDLVLAPYSLDIAPGAQVMASDSDLTAAVANDPAGIGFTRYSSKAGARALPIIGVCGLVVTPNEFNIKTEEYPLSHRHYAFTLSERTPEYLQEFMTYLTSEPAQSIVADAGMLSQTLSRGPVDQQGMRFASALQSDTITQAIPQLQEMVSEMIVSERLSATLRFETGSSELDDRAEADISRVAALLAEEVSDGSGRVVRVMGFTDSLGNPELNRELSIRRASQVTESLLRVDPNLAERVEFRPMGFGDVSPIGCDQTAQGRWTNRRVELWISNAAR